MSKSLKIWYWNKRPNAGDYFGKWLLDKMHINNTFSREPDICIAGSILQSTPVHNAKVWGLGYHTETEHYDYKPEQIYAVRGTLTRKQLKMSKYIPTGDPGLLASRFYPHEKTHKYKIGIIPHYVDEDFINTNTIPKNYKVIPIGTNDCEHVFNDICECDFIISSSLHGIIFSHSYGIPAMHIIHNPLYSIKQFKFHDYYSNFSIKYIPCPIRDMNELTDVLNTIETCLSKHPSKFTPSSGELTAIQNRLLDAFPFK